MHEIQRGVAIMPDGTQNMKLQYVVRYVANSGVEATIDVERRARRDAPKGLRQETVVPFGS